MEWSRQILTVGLIWSSLVLVQETVNIELRSKPGGNPFQSPLWKILSGESLDDSSCAVGASITRISEKSGTLTMINIKEYFNFMRGDICWYWQHSEDQCKITDRCYQFPPSAVIFQLCSLSSGWSQVVLKTFSLQIISAVGVGVRSMTFPRRTIGRSILFEYLQLLI